MCAWRDWGKSKELIPPLSVSEPSDFLTKQLTFKWDTAVTRGPRKSKSTGWHIETLTWIHTLNCWLCLRYSRSTLPKVNNFNMSETKMKYLHAFLLSYYLVIKEVRRSSSSDVGIMPPRQSVSQVQGWGHEICMPYRPNICSTRDNSELTG